MASRAGSIVEQNSVYPSCHILGKRCEFSSFFNQCQTEFEGFMGIISSMPTGENGVILFELAEENS